MNILSLNMWFNKLIRQFFFNIDQVVYNFISELYDLLISIARTSVLTQGDIIEMADKVYKLLTVFMVFKVTLSLITYVVNPDEFSDKNKGLSKLGSNIIISLSLLILTPYIFSYAYELQTIILEDNTLATLIFETDSENSEDNSVINTAGDLMAYYTMSPFFSPNVSILELSDCVNLKQNDVNYECTGVTKKDDGTYVADSQNGGTDKETLVALSYGSNQSFSSIDVVNYVVGMDRRNLGLFFRQEMALGTTDKDEAFVMEYKMIFSTTVGIVVVLLLLSYCMDVGVRSIKLAFLQIIAPIPILSYVDPKSSKDGLFKKWYDMCFKTYLSLFIRLLALYFAVYLIGKVDSMVDIVDGTYVTNGYIKIFIIIGALMFAKQLPNMLKGLGIKLDGDGKFTLNPLKKFEENAFGGKNITGMARGGLVGLAGAASGAGIGRGLSGAWRGLTSGKGWKETGKAEAEMNKKMRQARLDGSTFRGRLGNKISGALGLPTRTEAIGEQKHDIQDRIRTHEDEIKRNQEAKKRIESEKKQKKEAEHLTERKRSAKMISDSVGAIKSVASDKLATISGASGDKYRRLETDSRVLNNNIGHYRNSEGAIITHSEFSGLNDTEKNKWDIITEEMASTATTKFAKYKDDGWFDLVTEVHEGKVSDATIRGKLDAAVALIGTTENKEAAQVIQELEETATEKGTSFGEELKNRMGAAKGELTAVETRETIIDSEYVQELESIDKTIEEETIEKERLDEQIRNLREEETAAKANDSVM